jgi:hypothetical protein
MQTVMFPEPAVLDRKAMAREHAALFPTKLALARWTSGASPSVPDNGDCLSLQTAWLHQAQGHFQAWLEQGGFTQHDNADHVPPVADGQAQSADVVLD